VAIFLYNDEEIGRIRESCALAAHVLDEIDRIIDVGVTTYELDRFARDIIAKHRARPAFLGYKGFTAALCTSINEVVVHGIPSKSARLKSGDIVGIDVGVFLDGYYGDTARSFAIGAISKEARQLMDVTRASLYAGIDRCVVGNRISDVSHAIEAYVVQYGFLPVREFVGHGIGRSLHEEPPIPNHGKPGRGPRIKNGMVLAIEPMINVGTYLVDVDQKDGWTVYTKDRKLSAHFEHTVAVVNGRAEILTKGNNFS